MEPSAEQQNLEPNRNLVIPPFKDQLSQGISLIFPPRLQPDDTAGFDLNSVEIKVKVDEVTRKVVEFQFAFADGRWYMASGVDQQACTNIINEISSLCRSNDEEKSGLDLDAAWQMIHDQLLTDTRISIKDLMAQTEEYFARGEFPAFESIPTILQSVVGAKAIEAGLANEVFANFRFFKDKPGPVVGALVDIPKSNFGRALLNSMENTDGSGLSTIDTLDFETARSLIVSAVHYTAVTEVDTQELKILLRKLYKFREQDRGAIHRYLRETLLKCNQGQELFEIYEEMGKDNGKLLFELISIVNGWAPGSQETLKEHEYLPIADIFELQPINLGGLGQLFSTSRHNTERSHPRELDHPHTFEEAEQSIKEIYNLALVHKFKPGAYQGIVAGMVRSAVDRVNHMTLAGLLIVLGHTDVLIANLKLFSGLSSNLAKFLLEHGPGANVLQHAEAFEELDSSTILSIATKSYNIMLLQKFNSFSWDKETFLKAFELIIAENDFQKVLDTLSSVPEKFLSLTEEQFYLSSYLRDIGIPSSEIYRIYCDLKARSDEITIRGFCSEIQRVVENMVSTSPLTDDIKRSAYFDHILAVVFANHAGMWGFPKGILKLQAKDRSEHVSKFRIRPRYRISLAEGTIMLLKPGCAEDEGAIATVKQPIIKVQTELSRVNFDRELSWELLESKLDALHSRIPAGLRSKEEKIVALMLECLSGHCKDVELKEVLLMYHFAVVENIRGYLEGTRDMASRSKTPRYSELMYMREFLFDAMRDTTNKICKEALQKPAIKERLAFYHAQLKAKEAKLEVEQAINKAQVDKVGITPKLLTLLAQKITERGVSTDTKRKAVASIISKEQERLAALIEKLFGIKEEPNLIHLDSASLKVRNFLAQHSFLGEMPEAHTKRTSRKDFDEKYFKSYISEALALAFKEELGIIDIEIAKYKPATGERKRALVLEGFITKNEQSFWARGTAGVCVARDTWQWDQPNYFQMVLRDSASKKCEGLLMLHSILDRGRKILVVSFQPTSTYLFKVDETQLFRGFMEQLITFSDENGFDMIASSTNHAIRTNRTGGAFEMALDKTVRNISKRIVLKSKLQFSKSFDYKVDEIDVLWERAGAPTT